ncbi:Uncharacterized protein PBTT_03702 [Plasmodiophora brassicae]
MVDDGAPLSISHAVLDGVERGDSHAVAQMRTLIVQAHEQIATLENLNARLRDRVSKLVAKGTEIENKLLELKSAPSKDLDALQEQMQRRKDQMDHTLAELVEQNSRLLLEKNVLEGIVEDKNRRLVEVQAAYLMMMDKIEAQKIVLDQSHARSQTISDQLKQYESQLRNVSEIQLANQGLLDQYSKDVQCEREESATLRNANDELQLQIASQAGYLTRSQQRISELEAVVFRRQKEDAGDDQLLKELRDSGAQVDRSIAEVGAREKKHVDDLCRFSSFAAQLLQRTTQNAECQTLVTPDPVPEECRKLAIEAPVPVPEAPSITACPTICPTVEVTPPADPVADELPQPSEEARSGS